MEQSQTVLNGYGDRGNDPNPGAIAPTATADRKTRGGALQFLSALAKAASPSEKQEASVIPASTELSADEYNRRPEILKDSDLRYLPDGDLITFAKVYMSSSQDGNANGEKIVQYLQFNQLQFSLLDQFIHQNTERQANPEEVAKTYFIGSVGTKEKFQMQGATSMH